MDTDERIPLKPKKITKKQLMKHQSEKFSWSEGSVEVFKNKQDLEEKLKQKGVKPVWC